MGEKLSELRDWLKARIRIGHQAITEWFWAANQETL